jgi:protein-disulfide isomerase
MHSSAFPHQRLGRKHQLQLLLLVLVVGFFGSTVKSQNLETPAARVGDNVITQREVDESLGNQIYAVQQQLFALRKAALNNIISRKILESEAARQKLTIDQLKNKWMAGDVTVDPAQVEELFQKNRSAFGLMSTDEIREKLRIDLEGQVRLKRYRDALNALREKANVEVLIEEPRLKLLNASDTTTSRGPAGAKVVITEFSDFQCPYCRQVQGTLKEVLKQHADDVRLEFKHLPLDGHPFAFTAARSAFCGGKQGAFWKFHDALFDSTSLTHQTVETISQNLGLNQTEFAACLESQESQAAIMADLQEARRLGLDGTPSFIINGRPLLGAATVVEFNEAIARELNKLTLTTSTSQK